MKKFSLIVLSIVFTCACVLFSACTPKQKASITLSKSSVSIFLGETENNTVSIDATLQNVDVKALDLVYDTTYINASQTKNANGTFTISVTSKVDIGTSPIAIEVKAGNFASAIFYVEVVLPVSQIVANDNAYIAYNGEKAEYNLLDYISFLPSGTKQTGVEFNLAQESDVYSINGSTLTIQQGQTANDFQEPIVINVASTEEGKNKIGTELKLQVLPNIKLLSDKIDVKVSYDGNEDVYVQNQTYNLSIKKTETGYVLSEFVLKVYISQSLGIDVDLDATTGGGMATSILNYLSYAKEHTVDASNSADIKDVYIFTFETISALQGAGTLRLKFWYSDHSNDDMLSASFIKSESGLLDFVNVVVTMPITDINIKTNCKQDDATKVYTIYHNYSGIYGGEFKFIAMPEGTTQNELVLEKTQDSQLQLFNSNDQPLVFDENRQCTIKSGETIYIKGGNLADESITCFSKSKSSITKTLYFNVLAGTSDLVFVKDTESTVGTTETTLNAEVGTELKAIIYAPGITSLSDFSNYDASIIINNAGTTNYFWVYFNTADIGTQSYTIKTVNGFEIVANVNIIQPITNVSLQLNDSAEYISGVGSCEYSGENIEKLSVKNGYSVQLNYTTNENALISKINYSFFRLTANENGNVVGIDAYNLKNIILSDYNNSDFTELSSIINTQNIANDNIVTATYVGVEVVKIEIFGQVVKDGVIKIEVCDTKFVLLQIYNPVKSISASAKTITLRAENQLSENNWSFATKTLQVGAVSEADTLSTYYKVFIDGGKYYSDDGQIVATQTIRKNGIDLIDVKYDYATGKLTLEAKYVDSSRAGTYRLVLFAGDFIDYELSDKTIYREQLDKSYVEYIIEINLIETKQIQDITVSNLTLESEDETTKTYKTVYIDTSKSDDVTFRLFTSIEPIDAFDKSLKYIYTPDSGKTQAMLDISDDGIITVLSRQGGTGTITIEPAYVQGGVNIKKIVVPIVITDGNSWETAYEITSLNEIVSPNKHYVLTIPATYTLNENLFDEFSGGLYGKRYTDKDNASVSSATIMLSGFGLFNKLTSTAHIACLNICGNVNALDATTSQGFVANVNGGTIEQVKVTTYIKNGIYVPSLLSINAGATCAGGIVGTNNGTIKNCIFAGSIYVGSNEDATVGAIAGNSENGTVESCFVYVSKFDSSLSAQNCVLPKTIGEQTIYINGIIGTTGVEFTDATGVNIIKYSDSSAGIVWIKDYKENTVQQSYGEKDSSYGIVMYFKAKQESKQNVINEYNTISFANLLGTEDITGNLKVIAKNLDGTTCNFVTVNADSLTINGIGEFVLYVTSELDYTTVYQLNILSIYYANEFILSAGGINIDEKNLELLDGQKYEIVSKLGNLITVNGQNVELQNNDFDVKFTITGIEDTEKYITGTKLGSHTINMLFTDAGQKNVDVKLSCLLDAQFDALLNELFNMSNCSFTVQKKQGTSAIISSITEASVEPKDTVSFAVTLETDITGDLVEEDCVRIYNEYNIDITNNNYFNISVNKRIEANTFDVEISANLANPNLTNLVNKTYTIQIKAKSATENYYDAICKVKLNLLPQTISSINTVLHKISTTSQSGVIVSKMEEATSVLIPSLAGGILKIDMFPSFASFDYLELVATSNTMTKLAFRLQDKDSINDTLYKPSQTGYESIFGQNGIRILNNNQASAQNIGTYYVKLFADSSSVIEDTIFTLTVSAYLNGQQLTAKSIFTLYMKMPDAPQLSLNGETKVYALAGQTISGIECLIASDQNNSYAYIACDESNNSVIDNKSVSGFKVEMFAQSENATVGYRRYSISIMFPEDYTQDKISLYSTQFKLVVQSEKIINGNAIPVFAELYVYLVDYIVKDNDIVIFDCADNIFNVTSIKNYELKLADLPNNIQATSNFVDNFTKDYFFENSDTNFVFGGNLLNGFALNKAEILASYLSYVNGNVKTPLLKINDNGKLELVSNEYLTFDFEDNKLIVKGGNYTGTVNMSLEIPYKLPDGRKFTYEYTFSIVNKQYTSEDLPKEIANVDAFLGIVNETQAQDYILTNDLYLYDFTTINDTLNIKSLDGNNHTINIISYAQSEDANVFALFNEVSSGTTIKNLTVNLYHLSQIVVSSVANNVKVAGFAIQNNGSIYNCEVIAYKTTALGTISNVFGIKVDDNVNVNVAGFVITNNGSITNSRVGGTSKLITDVVYNVNAKGEIVPKVNQDITTAQTLTLTASGTISGFVEINEGVIASSFVKNINIINTYSKDELVVTSGFVNTNGGTISMCYVEGGFENETDIQSTIGGMEGSGIMAGFAYLNNNIISDCYSNLSITNTRDQVGRLGAGFVFENSSTGTIERCFSASKVISNNITQMNFAGIKDFGGYNNAGIIKTSYYFIQNQTEAIAIEEMVGTSITAILDAKNINDYYGFSFASTERAGTWIMKNRPALVSADDISHSVRAKYENTNINKNGIDYYFVYCDGFELGSKNNPIIIRDAKEFNSVFGGGSTLTDISNCFSLVSGKVYGAYRLVNDIDLLELVPEQEQDTDFKVNLISTKMTLTGENATSSQKDGSLNGNGLTIKNLAISNASTTSDNFGLFKSIENGAYVANLNIELSDAGVSADHTTFVGTLAGTLQDSYAFNIKISSLQTSKYTQIVGANVTGGAFGRVIGNSAVSNVTIENISAVSTYNENIQIGDGKETNVYNRQAMSFKNISISGGAFGVIDIYDASTYEEDVTYGTEDFKTPTISNIAVVGGMKIEAMTVGGVAGYIGQNVIARDLSLTIMANTSDAKISAYNCFAGGIVGYNRGYLYQIKAEHEASWQKEIENNIHSYYTAQDETSREAIDRGSLNLFNDEFSSPFAVGGLVGYENGGKISIAYSKVNVINNNARYIGGIIGYVCAQESGAEEDASKSLTLHEVYAVCDVYSNYSNAKIGGLIGYNNDAQIKINKANAMNYWGFASYEVFKENNGKTISSTINGETGGASGSGESASDKNKAISIKSIEFAGKGNIVIYNEDSNVFNSYYSYTGVEIDNGAQIDTMFAQRQWYSENNWSRTISDMFPHILYVTPQNIYKIETTKDFYKFILYGADPNVTFAVVGTATDPIIDCSNYQSTLGIIRGKIIGATNKNGFKNLKAPLFSEANGAEISNLIFENCTSAFVIKSKNTTFSNLSYQQCKFNYTKNGNCGGVALTSTGCTFNSIVFDSNCSLSSAQNAGFLFGGGEQGSGTTKISGIVFKEPITNVNISTPETLNKKSDYGYGLLFGQSSNSVIINNVTATSTLNLTVNDKSTTTGEGGSENTNIYAGLLAGSVATNQIDVDLSTIKVKSSGINVTFNEITNNNKKITVYVGGLVGSANKLSLSDANGGTNSITTNANATASETNASLDVITFAPEIKVVNSSSNNGSSINIDNLYMGTLAGRANTLSFDNHLYILGKEEIDGKTVFKEMSYFLATNNYIGGAVGCVQTVSADKGILAYYGDVVINSTVSADTYLNMGGLFGETQGTESTSIQNLLFDGTISFAGESSTGESSTGESSKPVETSISDSLNLRVGGLVGYNTTELTITNSVVAGEIILKDEKQNIKLNNEVHNISGVVGYNEGTLTLGDARDVIINDVIIVTTIFSDDANIDIISKGTYPIINNVKYCSSLTLSVTSKTGVENVAYEDFSSESSTNTVWASALGNTVKGSKLDPYKLGDGELQEKENATGSKNEYFFTIDDSTEGVRRTFESTYKRKLYVSVGSDETLNYQISLSNAVLFSQGKALTSYMTPINNINANSAVSGLIVKLYIDEDNDELKSSNFTNRGGLANENAGIIYTCSVQEQMNNNPVGGTMFNAYMYTTKVYEDGVGGFVGTNTGYIFGSNTNVELEGYSSNLSGFVADNQGKISYCYASGINACQKENGGFLFTEMQTESSGEETGGTSGEETGGASGEETSESSQGTFDNCYTIVMAKSKNISTKLPSGVYAEKDAVELNGVDDTTIYKKAAFIDGSDNYYACDDQNNYGYPTLSNGPFAGLTYTKRSTLCIANGETYGEKPASGSNDLYFQIPNLTVLKNLNDLVKDFNKFVIINNINVGYSGNDTYIIKEDGGLSVASGFVLDGYGKSLDNVKLSSGNLINSVSINSESGSDALIKNIHFGGNIILGGTGIFGSIGSGVKLSNLVFDDPTTIYLNTKNYNSNTYVGVLVGTNNGTIENCSATYSITASGKSTAGYTLGGLVGKNTGTVTNCTSKVSTYIDEQNLSFTQQQLDKMVVFGGIIGENTGTATNLTLEAAASASTFILTQGGNLLKEEDYKTYNQNKLETEKDLAVVGYKAQIFVRTNNKAIVGGIVGVNSGNGTIAKSYTFKNTPTINNHTVVTSEPKIDLKSSAILVGDEQHQMIAYAGGIVGMVNGGHVQDCSNLGNVTAMSVWQFVTSKKDETIGNPQPMANYTINANGIAVQCSSNTNYNGYVYYEGSTGEPTLVYDDNATIYIYREMSSLAFAGGIAGAGISSVSPDANASEGVNVRLANYGTISGGFRAVKPVATLQSAIDVNDKMAKSKNAYWISEGVTITAVVAYNSVKYIHVPGWVDDAVRLVAKVAVLISVPIYLINVNSLYSQLTDIYLNVNICVGNSNNYFGNLLIAKLFNDSENWGNNAKTKINETLGIDKNFSEPEDVNVNNYKNYYQTASKFLGGGNEAVALDAYWAITQHNNFIYPKISVIGFLTNIVLGNSDLKITQFDQLIKIQNITPVKTKTISFASLPTNTNIYELKEFAYDSICPDLTGEDCQVYTDVEACKKVEDSSDEKTLYSGNPENEKLKFKNISENILNKHNSVDEDNISNWDDWSKDLNDCYVPINMKEKYEISTTNGLIEQNGVYTYTLQDANCWKNIVYTINNAYDTLTDETEKNKFLNMQISVALNIGEKIDVGEYTLHKFNGSIEFKSSKYTFTNVMLTKDTNGGMGIIESTDGCYLNRVNVSGNVNVANNNNGLSVGILIGMANNNGSALKISNSNIKLQNVAVSAKISNFGMVVGMLSASNNDDLKSNILSNISFSVAQPINISNAVADVALAEGACFGVVIGQIEGNNQVVLLDNVTTSGTVNVINFGSVGGVVGTVNNANMQLGNLGSTQLDVSLIGVSNSNIYVGGIVGTNKGTLNINSDVKIGSKTAIIISADVSDASKNAYAGGIAGLSEENAIISVVNYAKIYIGNSAESYNNVSYIFAGFNIANQGASTLPKFANASKSIALNNANQEVIDIKFENTLVRYVYRDEISNDVINSKTVDMSDLNRFCSISVEKVDGEDKLNIKLNDKSGDYKLFEINGNKLISTQKTLDPIDTNGDPYLTYKFKPEGQQTFEEISLAEDNNGQPIVEESTSSIEYKLETISSSITSSKITNTIDYQYRLTISYKEELGQYKLKSGSYLSYSENTVNYQYLINLTSLNAKLNDFGKYSITVTKINDYDVNLTTIGTIKTSPSEEENDYTNEFPIYKYEYESKEVNEVIFSSLIDSASNTELTISNSIKLSLSKKINENKEKAINSDGDYVTSQKTIDATLSHTNFTVKLENGIFTFGEKWTYEIDAFLSETVIDKSTYNLKSSKMLNDSISESISRDLFTVSPILTGKASSQNVGESTLKGEIDYIVNVNNEQKSSGSYTVDSKLNNVIELDYSNHRPQYVFKGCLYDKVKTYKHALYGKEYLIVSCANITFDIASVTEYIYEKSGTELIDCGYISYTLNNYDSYFGDSNEPERYESFFPVVGDISNVCDNLQKTENKTGSLTIANTYYEAQVDITSTSGDLYYTYTITYTKYSTSYTVDSDGNWTEGTTEAKESTTSSAIKIYFEGTTGLGGALVSKEVDNSSQITTNNISSESDVPEALKTINNLLEYYTYNGEIVGYKVEKEQIEYYYYYRDGKSKFNSINELKFYASTGELADGATFEVTESE